MSSHGHGVKGSIFGGKRVLYTHDVGKNYGSGTGNNKTTAHPYSGPREEERARKRLARMQAGNPPGASKEKRK